MSRHYFKAMARLVDVDNFKAQTSVELSYKFLEADHRLNLPPSSSKLGFRVPFTSYGVRAKSHPLVLQVTDCVEHQ